MNKFIVVYDKNNLQLIEDINHLNKSMVIAKLKGESFVLPRRLQGIVFSSVFSKRKVSIFSTELDINQLTELHGVNFQEFTKITEPGILT